jgi:hypothetical protein
LFVGDRAASRVFITHSSHDRALADRLVGALRLGTDVTASRIFCSSIEGFGVKVGSDFMAYIQRQLKNTQLVVPIITPAYLDSVFCQWELGAAWVREAQMFPIRVEPVAHNELPSPLEHVHVAELTESGLDNLVECVAESVGSVVHRRPWADARTELLHDLPELLSKLGIEWRKTPQAKLRRASLLAAQSKTLHKVFHLLRDAAAPRLLGTKDDWERFLERLDKAVDEIAALFTGATGKACRVTVKEVYVDEDDVPLVRDIARSDEGNLRPEEPIEGNTDFESLLRGDESYYKCNNIQELRDAGNYENTHMVADKPLSYNSTIVWPVRIKLRRRPNATKKLMARNWLDLIAYLCVDSEGTDVFDEIDVWVGAAIADAMYMVLRPWSGEGDEDDSPPA